MTKVKIQNQPLGLTMGGTPVPLIKNAIGLQRIGLILLFGWKQAKLQVVAWKNLVRGKDE